MSYVVELSQKLAALKTQIREILASHGITVSATDSIDYYMEKLKTLKIINQDKTIFYGGNYEAEEGYSGFGKLNIDINDGGLVNLFSEFQEKTVYNFDNILNKYNIDDPTAEYIVDPYSGPTCINDSLSSNYTASTIQNLRFNNVKKMWGYINLNYTGLKDIVNITFPDLIEISWYENSKDTAQYFITGDTATNSVSLESLYLPQLRSTTNVDYLCRYLKDLKNIYLDNLEVCTTCIAYTCPSLLTVSCPNLRKITNSVGFSFLNTNANLATICLPNLEMYDRTFSDSGVLITTCNALTELKLPNFTHFINNLTVPMIISCTSLELISLPKLEELPKCSLIGHSGNSTVTYKLKTLHFGNLHEFTQTSGYFTFINGTYCQYPYLENLILEGDCVLPLPSVNWFNSSVTALPYFYNKTGNIYVPNDLVDDYKNATNWSTLDSMIKPLSTYIDTDNIITRHNGYMNIDVVQNNCTVYINGIEKTILTNLPFYPNKDYNIVVIDSTNNRTHVETLNFSNITTKNITIDLTQKQFKSLTINTNAQDPDIELYYKDVLISTSNVINVSQNAEITYKIGKFMYKNSIGTIVVDQNKTINITLEETNIDIELEPGDTSWGWKIADYTNPKASDGWIMYQSINPSGTTNYAVAKIHVKNLTSFTCYINSYAYSTYNYTMISNADASSYPTTSSATTAKANTNGKQYIPTTFNTTNWTTVTYSGLSTAEHIIYVVYRRSRTTSGGYNAGFLLFDPDQ